MSAETAPGEFDASSYAERVADFSWLQAVAAGFAAFLAGYLLTILLVVLGPGSTAGALWGVLVLIAFVFYSAHDVPAVVEGTLEVNYLRYVGEPGPPEPSVPLVAYYAVPLVVLLATGALAVYRYGENDGTPVDALLTGLGGAAGYTAAAILGTFVFRTRSLFGGLSKVDLEAAATFGFAYPLVFVTFAAVLVQFARYVRTDRQA